jgi:stage II sporulation protein M
MNLKKIKSISILRNYLEINIKEYIITFGIFLVGIFLGVIFINKTNDTQFQEIKQYIEQYIQINKENDIDTQSVLRENIKDNIVLVFILWFAGTTIIGIPIVLGVVLFRGFCLGYTIAATISSIRNMETEYLSFLHY